MFINLFHALYRFSWFPENFLANSIKFYSSIKQTIFIKMLQKSHYFISLFRLIVLWTEYFVVYKFSGKNLWKIGKTYYIFEQFWKLNSMYSIISFFLCTLMIISLFHFPLNIVYFFSGTFLRNLKYCLWSMLMSNALYHNENLCYVLIASNAMLA